MKIFEKEYDGESIYDAREDVVDCFDSLFNPIVGSIPKGEYGFHEGTFKVTIEWINE
jgi:hypothetical protein